jgi:hypothetical protein
MGWVAGWATQDALQVTQPNQTEAFTALLQELSLLVHVPGFVRYLCLHLVESAAQIFLLFCFFQIIFFFNRTYRLFSEYSALLQNLEDTVTMKYKYIGVE